MDNNCTYPGCTKPLVYKKVGLCQNHYMQKRREDAKKRSEPKPELPAIPPEIYEAMQTARTGEDWQKLAAVLAPSMGLIMSGKVNASAAQVSLIKDIMNRAYGKPVATQADKSVSTGIVLLPTLDNNKEHVLTCPQCSFDALQLLQDDSTKAVGLKVLRELLEKLIAEYSTITLES